MVARSLLDAMRPVLEALLGDGDQREAELAACIAAPEHVRAATATKLAAIAREAAAAIAAAEEQGASTAAEINRFSRAIHALALLRVEHAKRALLGIADDCSFGVRRALARALRGTTTPEGRAVLVRLLADDDMRVEAILAIGAAPWPEVLPSLIEIAEADENAARFAAAAIAKCGATAGPKETYAAADYLVEQLDDDSTLAATVAALMRWGTAFPGVADKARQLAKESGKRKVAGLCLLAACSDEESSRLVELALTGAKADAEVAWRFLLPLLEDEDERVRSAAERARKALDLR
jgi:hypothetical protein